MVKDEQRMPSAIRGFSPCKNCEERFIACSDKCPKDIRGEYGYKAWKAEIERVKHNRKQYLDDRCDDMKRRETWGIKR